jgi:hypothetical protein
MERIVMVGTSTKVRADGSSATSTPFQTFRTGDYIIAVGAPDADGHVIATFVRVMPMMRR